MEAGRELDVLIAEKVMGHNVLPNAHCTAAHGSFTDYGLADSWEDGYFEPVPHYSTDIAAAWQVVEHLRLQRYYFTLDYPPRKGRTWAAFYSPNRDVEGEEVDSAPLAICLAALKVVEV